MVESESEMCDDGLVNVMEAAAFLGLPRASMYQLLKDGALPFSRLTEKRICVPRRALIAYANARMVLPGGDAA